MFLTLVQLTFSSLNNINYTPSSIESNSLTTPNNSSFDCGLIRVIVIIDNNCNGKYDPSDQYAENWQVNLSPGNRSFHTTDQYGQTFYSNLSAGTYQSQLIIQNGYYIGSSTESVILQGVNDVGLLTYFVCKECKPDFKITQTKAGDSCCPTFVQMMATGNYPITSVKWSTGQIGPVGITQKSGQFTATITYDCGGTTKATIVSTKVNMGRGGFPTISYTSNTVTPSNPLVILDNNYGLNELGAYNANEYKLAIFNRWGGLIYEASRKNCNGLKNGEIRWDGTSNTGVDPQQGVLAAYVVLENCEYQCKNDNWRQNLINGVFKRCKKNIKTFEVIYSH